MSRYRAEMALAFNCFVWGATFIVVKRALDDVSPLMFLALRFTLAALALSILFRRSLRAMLRAWGGIMAGSFLFLGYAFQTFGLRLTSAPKSAFLTGLSTAMVPLLAALVYRNRPRAGEIAGVVLATSGMALMTLQSGTLTMGTGDLLTLGCAAAFAAHIVVLGHYAEEMPVEVLSLTQVVTAALLSLATFGWGETPRFQASPEVLAAVLLTGLLATALAFSIQAWAQRYTTSTRTAVIFTLEPIVALLTSWLLAGETLSRRGVAGAGLILAGILLVELKPPEPVRHP